MKIGYFVINYPYSNPIFNKKYFGNHICGGAPRAAYYLAKQMINRGNEVKIFTTSINSKNSTIKNVNNTIYRYGTIFKVMGTHLSYGQLIKPQKHRVDIAHGHFDIPPGPISAYLYSKRKNKPLIITYHGDWAVHGYFFRKIGVSFFNKFIVNKILDKADIIISPSLRYTNQSKFLYKHKNKTITIPNGINLSNYQINLSQRECREKLGLDIEKKIILYVGSLSPYKGTDILLRSMPRVLKEIHDAYLIYVGEGIMEKNLLTLARKLGISEKIYFPGFIGSSYEKALFYKSADIMVLPSFAEIFGIVNLEAMAAGIPIIASNVGGIPDVVKDGENGLIIPPHDVKSLEKSIIYLLTNNNVRERFVENGRKMVLDYSWELIAEKTEKIYEELL